MDKDNVLDQMVTKKLIIGYIERHTENTILFQVSMPSASMTLAEQVGIHHTFKLTTAISTSNMMLLDAQGRIKKYDSPLEFKNRIKCIRQLRSHHVCFQDQIDRLYEAAMVRTRELIALRSNTVQALWLSDLLRQICHGVSQIFVLVLDLSIRLTPIVSINCRCISIINRIVFRCAEITDTGTKGRWRALQGQSNCGGCCSCGC